MYPLFCKVLQNKLLLLGFRRFILVGLGYLSYLFSKRVRRDLVYLENKKVIFNYFQKYCE